MDTSEQLMKIMRALNARFVLNGRPMTLAEVCSPSGLLPAIAKRADQLCALCLGYGIGAVIEEAENTMLGTRVTFDDLTPSSLRLLCLFDVVYELIRNTSPGQMTPLDQLMYDQ